jgi:hypothetical protein
MEIVTDVALRDALEPLLGERLATALVWRLRPDPDPSGDQRVANLERRVRALARAAAACTSAVRSPVQVIAAVVAVALALTAVVAIAATAATTTAAVVTIATTHADRTRRPG